MIDGYLFDSDLFVGIIMVIVPAGYDNNDDADDDDDGLPAYSHQDKTPTWREYVSNDRWECVSDKIPPYMKNIIGSIYVSKYNNNI